MVHSEDQHYLIAVALPTPLRRCFHYQVIGQTAPVPGQRVKVPFGPRELVGIITSLPEAPDIDPDKLKTAELIDQQPILDDKLLALCEWAARYYQHPIGEVLAATLPVQLRSNSEAGLPTQTRWQLTVEGLGLPEGAPKGARKQAELLTLLRTGSRSPEQIHAAGYSKAIIKALQNKGLIEAVHLAERQTFNAPLGEAPLTANVEQQAVLDALPDTGFWVGLLEGVTGSGKTEVYLQAIERQLAAGRQALVLVPEIGLTPQTVQRFTRRFKVPVGTLHSGVSDGGRSETWQRAAAGLDRIIIGTRSAIFTPLKHPGIIIVDEEHDLSYKQQEGFRYSARDLAVYRAHQLQIPLLLGSATPSLESLNNARNGRYQHLRLQQRPAGRQAAHMHTLDIRGKPLHEGLAEPALSALGAALERGEQAMVFINRRGFAPVLMCHFCGWQSTCPRCDARMTLHRQPAHLHCHHCDLQRRIPGQCPDCQAPELTPMGAGTERTEAFLGQRFPNYPTLRIDRDATRSHKQFTQVLNEIHSGRPCLLVGTQMLAKGHHFPRVSTVVIVDADGGLFSADFRGAERMAQLITQVAGRAGREQLRGQVILQTHNGDHPYLQTLLQQGYGALARLLLGERQLAELPPYSHMTLLRAESKRADNAQQFLHQARQLAEQIVPPNPGFRYLGPLPAAMEKRQDRYRFVLQVQANKRPAMQQFLAAWVQAIEQLALAKRVRWSLDVDPQETQ